MRTFGVHWPSVGGLVLIITAAGFDLPFARSHDEYTFCHWLVLAL